MKTAAMGMEQIYKLELPKALKPGHLTPTWVLAAKIAICDAKESGADPALTVDSPTYLQAVAYEREIKANWGLIKKALHVLNLQVKTTKITAPIKLGVKPPLKKIKRLTKFAALCYKEALELQVKAMDA